MSGLEPWFPTQESFSEQNSIVSPSMPAPMPATQYPIEHASSVIAKFDSEELPPIPSSPELMQKLVSQALLLLGNHESRLAERLLRNALMRDSKHPEALRWMSHCLKSHGKLEDAAKCARALYQCRPDGTSLFILGEILYQQEKDQDAKTILQESIAQSSENSFYLFEALKLLGNTHLRLGDVNSAEESYNKAFAMDPNSDALLVNYGTLEIQREDLTAAVVRFRSAIQVNSENDRAWVGLALVHRQMGDSELAWANLERALDAQPTNRTALRLAIDWLAQDGFTQDRFNAIADRLQRYLGKESDDAEMSYALARIFVMLRHFRAAGIEAERSLSLDPRRVEAAQLLQSIQSRLRQEAGQPSEARM